MSYRSEPHILTLAVNTFQKVFDIRGIERLLLLCCFDHCSCRTLAVGCHIFVIIMRISVGGAFPSSPCSLSPRWSRHFCSCSVWCGPATSFRITSLPPTKDGKLALSEPSCDKQSKKRTPFWNRQLVVKPS